MYLYPKNWKPVFVSMLSLGSMDQLAKSFVRHCDYSKLTMRPSRLT